MQIVAIHVAPGSRLPVRSLDAVVAEAGKGLVGDRYHGTGAAAALRRRAGSACRVLTSGTIRIGDSVTVDSGTIGA